VFRGRASPSLLLTPAHGARSPQAPAFLEPPSGAPTNVTITVSRLRGEAAFVGKARGRRVRHLRPHAHGHPPRQKRRRRVVVFDAGTRTALTFVTLRADGECEFMFSSADMLFTAELACLPSDRSSASPPAYWSAVLGAPPELAGVRRRNSTSAPARRPLHAPTALRRLAVQPQAPAAQRDGGPLPVRGGRDDTLHIGDRSHDEEEGHQGSFATQCGDGSNMDE
jgi:hypothetical protein